MTAFLISTEEHTEQVHRGGVSKTVFPSARTHLHPVSNARPEWRSPGRLCRCVRVCAFRGRRRVAYSSNKILADLLQVSSPHSPSLPPSPFTSSSSLPSSLLIFSHSLRPPSLPPSLPSFPPTKVL